MKVKVFVKFLIFAGTKLLLVEMWKIIQSHKILQDVKCITFHQRRLVSHHLIIMLASHLYYSSGMD